MLAYDGSLNFDTKIDSSGFQEGVNKIGGIAEKGLNATKAILTGASAAIGAMGVAAIKVGSDFEGAMSKVKAISGTVADQDLPNIIQKAKDMSLSFVEGANATETALNILSAKAQEMGAATKFSATESANAFKYMAMAGWKTEDMLSGIEGIMNLAAASGEDLAATSDIVTDALTAFGMSAEESTHFADVLAAASSNANTNVGMMGETFKYVAPLAGALKYSAEDTAVAIGLMANSSIKGSQAGTSLRSILTRLAKPTKESATAMEALGLSITDSSGKTKPFLEVIGDMRSAFSGLTEEQQASYAAMLGGQEAMSGLLAIVNASEDDFNKLQGSIYSCDGAAAEMAETMQDNLQGQLTNLRSKLEGLCISFYENMQTPLKEIAVEAQGMVQQLQEAFKENGLEGAVTAFGEVLAQIVEKAAEAVPELVDTASELVSAFCESLRNSPGIGEAAAGLIASLIIGLVSSTGALWSAAVVVFSEFLSGLIGQFPRIFETGKEAAVQFGQAVTESMPFILSSAVFIVKALYDGIMETLPQITGAGVAVLNHLAEGISSSLPAMIPAAMQALMEFSGSLRENIGLLVDAGLNLVMTLAQSLIDNIPVFIETIPTIITNIAGIINDNAPKLLMCGIELIGKLALGILKSVPTLVANIPQIIQAIVSVILAFNWMELGGSIVKGLANGIKNLASAIPNAFREFCTNAHGIVSNFGWSGLGKAIIQLLKNGISSLAGLIPQSLGSIATTALNAIKNIDWWGLGINIIRGLASGVVGAGGELVEAAMKAASGLLDAVKDFFGIHSPSTVMAELGGFLVEGMANGISSMPEALAQYLEDTVNLVVQWGINLKNTAETWVTDTIDSVVNFFSQLPGKIWAWLIEIVNREIQWGINLKNTAETWVANTINSVVNFFSQMPGRIWTWLVDTVNKVTQWGVNLLSTASMEASNTVNKVVEWFSQLPGKIWTWLQNTITKVIQFGADMASKASSAAQGFVTNIVNGLSGLPGQMVTIGSNIVTGIWNGISSGWGWLKDKVSSLANSLFEAAKDALGIHSPSKVFADEVGRWIPPGIGVGIEKTMPDLQEQLDAEMDALAGRMQTAVAIETGGITVRTRAEAERTANIEYPRISGDTYIDQHIEQKNDYHVPVATPSEVSKAGREAARKLLGGMRY